MRISGSSFRNRQRQQQRRRGMMMMMVVVFSCNAVRLPFVVLCVLLLVRSSWWMFWEQQQQQTQQQQQIMDYNSYYSSSLSLFDVVLGHEEDATTTAAAAKATTITTTTTTQATDATISGKETSLSSSSSANPTAITYAVEYMLYKPQKLHTSINSIENQKPKPVQIIEQYMKWHNVDVVKQEEKEEFDNNANNENGEKTERKYAVGFYSCPHSAGNRLHEFMNDFLISIITNRTMLYKFYDHDACKLFRYGRGKGRLKGPLRRCEQQSERDVCDQMLRIRDDWLPSYDEIWTTRQQPKTKNKLRIPFVSGVDTETTTIMDKDNNRNNGESSVSTSASNSSDDLMLQQELLPDLIGFHARSVSLDLRKDSTTSTVGGSNIDIVITNLLPAVSVAAGSGTEMGGERGQQRQHELVKSTIEDLYSYGPSFLYGLLFHSLFNFTDAVMSSVEVSSSSAASELQQQEQVVKPSPPVSNSPPPPTTPGTRRIAVHSRHAHPDDDGCDVARETKCVDGLLTRLLSSSKGEVAEAEGEGQAQVKQQQRCVVYAMADRNCTLWKLKDTLNGKCEVYFADHNKITSGNNQSRITEHGPFAGIGFFQDIAFLSRHARDGVVVGHIPGEKIRTSSALVRELVEYNRRMDIWYSSLQHHPNQGQQQHNNRFRKDNDVALTPPPPPTTTTTSTAAPAAEIEDAKICKYIELHTGLHDVLNLYRNSTARKQALHAFEPVVWNARRLSNSTRSPYCFSNRNGLAYVHIDDEVDPLSIGPSVTLRIAQNVGKRDNNKDNNATKANSTCTTSIYNVPNHRSKRNKEGNQAFMWSLLRDPTARHVGEISRRSQNHQGSTSTSSNDSGGGGDDESSLSSLFSGSSTDTSLENFANYYFRWVPTLKMGKKRRKLPLPTRMALLMEKGILQSYDFIGIVARIDESIVVLQMLLGLDTSDVLYLDSSSTNTDSPLPTYVPDTTGKDPDRCNLHAVDFHNSNITAILSSNNYGKGLKEYLSSELYKASVYYDELLYQTINLSLDKTIDNLGREAFERNLQKYRQAKAIVERSCLDKVKFPCTRDGTRRKLNNETDCIFDGRLYGCGFDCIDQAEMLPF